MAFFPSFFSSRIVFSVLFFVLAAVLLVVVKPKTLFDRETGEAKPFGLGPGRTLFSLGVVVCTMAVTVFYVFGIIDMVYACANVSGSRSRERTTSHLPSLPPPSPHSFSSFPPPASDIRFPVPPVSELPPSSDSGPLLSRAPPPSPLFDVWKTPPRPPASSLLTSARAPPSTWLYEHR